MFERELELEMKDRKELRLLSVCYLGRTHRRIVKSGTEEGEQVRKEYLHTNCRTSTYPLQTFNSYLLSPCCSSYPLS